MIPPRPEEFVVEDLGSRIGEAIVLLSGWLLSWRVLRLRTLNHIRQRIQGQEDVVKSSNMKMVLSTTLEVSIGIHINSQNTKQRRTAIAISVEKRHRNSHSASDSSRPILVSQIDIIELSDMVGTGDLDQPEPKAKPTGLGNVSDTSAHTTSSMSIARRLKTHTSQHHGGSTV